MTSQSEKIFKFLHDLEKKQEREKQEASNGNSAKARDRKIPGLSLVLSAFRWMNDSRRFCKYSTILGREFYKYSGPLGPLAKYAGSKLVDIFKWSAFEREHVHKNIHGEPNLNALGRLVQRFNEQSSLLESDIFYKKDYKRDEWGDLIYSRKRMAKTWGGAAALALSSNLLLSAAYYYATKFDNDVIYPTGKQELVDGTLYQFSGCTSLPCSTKEDNGRYYNIEKSIIFPTLIMPEEDVYANISMDSQCRVSGYGIYIKTLGKILKYIELYRHATSIECRPLTDAERSQIVNVGSLKLE